MTAMTLFALGFLAMAFYFRWRNITLESEINRIRIDMRFQLSLVEKVGQLAPHRTVAIAADVSKIILHRTAKYEWLEEHK